MPTSPLQPERAIVRPRVRVGDSTVPRLLEEVVAEWLAAGGPAVLYLEGGAGSGRSTALAHLAAMFPGEARLRLVDSDGRSHGDGGASLTLYARRIAPNLPTQLRMCPWDDDDVVEYVASAHRECAAGALARWHGAESLTGVGRWPGLCRGLVDRFAAGADGAFAAIHGLLRAQWPLPALQRQRQEAALLSERKPLRRLGDVELADPWLQAPAVRAWLAAEHYLRRVVTRNPIPLSRIVWSPLLVAAIAHGLRTRPHLHERLRQRSLTDRSPARASCVSLLCAATVGFRVEADLDQEFDDARLVGADLRGLRLTGRMAGADLSGACLEGARLTELAAPRLCASGLRAAGVTLQAAHLNHSDLRGADLTACRCESADLRGADLRGAVLRGATAVDVNLRGALWDGADLRGVTFRACQMAKAAWHGVQLDGARFHVCHFDDCDLTGNVATDLAAVFSSFRGALLTDSRWRGAVLTHSGFEGAGLAGVDWVGADLRGCRFARATFQLGSSRSGLVGSDIACEGSRTGFYTDESLEQGFRPPEEVRKADLRNCDLRGAQLRDCDFYLVDLRGARLDPGQLPWLRSCRAILDREAAAG